MNQASTVSASSLMPSLDMNSFTTAYSTKTDLSPSDIAAVTVTTDLLNDLEKYLGHERFKSLTLSQRFNIITVSGTLGFNGVLKPHEVESGILDNDEANK